jgi:hypothetical protein
MAAPALAQGSGDFARRAVTHLAQTLAADTHLPDSLRRITETALVALPDSGYVRVLEDSEASDFIKVLATSLHQLPDSLCGRFLAAGSGDPPDLRTMLPLLDSVTVRGWLAVLEGMVRARARSQPILRTASPEEVRAAYVAIMNTMEPDRRQHLAWVAQHPPPTVKDACWSIQVIMDGMAQLPVAQLGPVARTNFGSPQTAKR